MKHITESNEHQSRDRTDEPLTDTQIIDILDHPDFFADAWKRSAGAIALVDVVAAGLAATDELLPPPY